MLIERRAEPAAYPWDTARICSRSHACPGSRSLRACQYIDSWSGVIGQPLELFCYQNSDHRYWNPPRPHAGFVTGSQGLGHAVFATPDIRTHVDFYIDAMGFTTSDIVKLAAPLGEMWFLRANPRHHSVAFVLGGDANPDLLMNLGRHVGDQTVSNRT